MQQQRRRPPVPPSPVAFNNNMNRPVRQVNRNMPMTVNQCSGCSQPMYNPLLSNVLDRLWHPDCVRCTTCRCTLNEQCYSREGKLYCKDDFIKKYIHRCFSCQNLIQSHEFIRRVRPGRIYHADCLLCLKCKGVLRDNDIASLLPANGSSLNDMDYVCQTCSNATNKLVKSSAGATSSSNADEDETTDSEVSNPLNGKGPSKVVNTDLSSAVSSRSPMSKTPVLSSIEQLSLPPTLSNVDNQIDDSQTMQDDEVPTRKVPAKARSSSSNSSLTAPLETTDEIVTPPLTTKATTRQTKTRQNSASNTNNKRTPAKSKATTAPARQKQTTANERKGRPPATRSKSSTAAATTVQTRSSNRRNTKTSRYRKRTFSSGSDEDETEDEDDDEDDADFSDEDDAHDDEREDTRSPATKTKASKSANDKKLELESTLTSSSSPPPPTATVSVTTPSKMSEPLSLFSGLASNPISVSSMMKSDMPASYMPPNFNPAFPTPQQFLPPNHSFPPGFPLQPRLPMPPPPSSISQSQSLPSSDAQRSSHPSNVPEAESLNPLADLESGRQAVPLPISASKPSALSSLLEFGTLPPSNLGDARPTGTPTNLFPFPFVTPGPGIPFSPQAAAGMTSYFRPSFGVSPLPTTPLDTNQQSTAADTATSEPTPKSTSINAKKKKSPAKRNLTDDLSQDTADDSPSPKKKARKTNPRGKGKAKKNDTDGENDVNDDQISTAPINKRKKNTKKNAKDKISTDDADDTPISNGSTPSTSHNLLAQMGLVNNSFGQPASTSSSQSSSSANAAPLVPNAQQQAQIAAMYNMTPHFAAYNTFPNTFNPTFPGSTYPGGYPSPYGFHPAFGTSPAGQPFPYMPPTSTASSVDPTPLAVPTTATTTSPESTSTDDKPAPIVVPETRPSKSKSKKATGDEKKKPATPRASKKKAAPKSAPTTVTTESEEGVTATDLTPTETTIKVTTTKESTSTPTPASSTTKRRITGTESEDLDEQNEEQQSQNINGKSGNESDGSTGVNDRSLNATQSTSSSSAMEKKGGRTTIKPQQLEILNKAFDSCPKPNKTQREELATDTGLNIRVIQVWFQNKRSKERKGKASKEKGASLDEDEAGDDSPPVSPQPPTEAVSTTESTTEPAPVISHEA